MISKFRLFFFIISLCYFKSEAQIFYVSSAINPQHIPTGSNIYKVTITPNGIVSELLSNCSPNDQFFSIAMNKSGFYWLQSPYLRKADMIGNNLANCSRLTTAAGYSNALTIGPDQKAYYCTNNLYTTDLNTLQTVSLGPMSYFPTGDMCFYNGGLYMAASQGIVKVDITDPTKSSVYLPISQNLNIFGLVSVATSLRKNTVYGLASKSSETDIIEIDIDNKQIVGIVGTLPYGVLDAASPVEDGSITGIELDKIEINQDCSAPNKAIVEVLTRPHLEEFTYVLNGVSNTTGKFTGIAPGTYTVTITSASDQLSSTITVGNYDLMKPNYSWQRKNEMCGVTGEITFNTADASSTYKIKYGGNLFPLNHTFTGLNSGSTYHFDIINKNGCKVDEADILMLKDVCKIELDQVQVIQQCDVFHKGIIKVLTKPHTYAYTYTLNGSVSNSTGVFDNLSTGQYTIKIKSSEDELEITSIQVPDYKLTQPAIDYNKNNPSCNLKGDIKFSIAGNGNLYKIQYKTDVVPFDHTFNNLSAGMHHFVVLNQAGCLIDEYDVELVYQPCNVEITDIELFAECDVLGKSVVRVICPAIPETYTYSLNGMTNNTGLFNMLSPGSYILNVSASGGGLPKSQTVVVPDYTLNRPSTLVNKTDPVCELPGQINLTIRTNPELYMIRYNASTYPLGHTFTGLYAGNYNFSILKKNGCIVDNINVQMVREECSEVSFPSAFSPNADGVNDIFKANSTSKASNFKIQIYDRRGILMTTSNQLQNCWNGEYKGKAVPTATYFWVATFTTQQNKNVVQKGSVTIMR